jgi:F-type H+-transporting ATPase subunit beta
VPKVWIFPTIEGRVGVGSSTTTRRRCIVRTIAMGFTDGMKRGLVVENTNKPVSVPVAAKH